MNEYSSIHNPPPHLSESPRILKDLPELTQLVRGFTEQEPHLPIPRLVLQPLLGLVRKEDALIYLICDPVHTLLHL